MDIVLVEAVPVGLLPALSSTMAPATLRHTSAATVPIPSNQTSDYLKWGMTSSERHFNVSMTTSRGTDDVQLHSNIISSVVKASLNM